MKTFFALSSALLLATAIPGSAAEPSKENDRDQQQAATLAKEVQGQLAAMADNQAKIDAKTAAIAEALRLARIYASRSGK
ncbi:MAG: hypothetical protein ACJ8M4_11510 [Chthoniobacterales bacterium]